VDEQDFRTGRLPTPAPKCQAVGVFTLIGLCFSSAQGRLRDRNKKYCSDRQLGEATARRDIVIANPPV